MHRVKNKKVLTTCLTAILLVLVVLLAWPNASKTATGNGFNKSLYATDIASSLWVVVNKGRALPADYVPAKLVVPKMPLRLNASSPGMFVRSDTAAALEAMATQASKDGINLMLTSGYRSYVDQATVHENYAQTQSVAAADSFSARAGHSEHQTGLAADLEPTSQSCELDQCFDSTLEGKWLAANCYKYGFIIRYQKDTTSFTGYEYEPWHIRYVGKDLAAQLQITGQTLEQFFSLPFYINYPSVSLTLKT
jgi:D-alanyl-D-alanine carboxypeptidase